MNVSPINITNAMPNLLGTKPSRDAIFSQMLTDRMGNSVEGDPVRAAAKELVSVSFILPLLKQARNDPFQTELFHGGSGENMFGSQLDQQLAKRMVDRMNMPLVDVVYDKFAQGTNEHG